MCSSSTRKPLNSEQSHKEENVLPKTYSKKKFQYAPESISNMANYVKDKKRVRDHNGFRRRAAGLCIRGLCNFPIFDVSKEFQILLVSGRADRDYWVLPGGGVEEWESSEQAVVREFKEEAGAQVSIVAKIGEFTVSFLH